MRNNYVKKIFSLSILLFLFASFFSLSFGVTPGIESRGACPITAQPRITSLDSISEFVQQFTSHFFNGACWGQHFLNILIYFLVPIAFLAILLYAIMSEIGIFSNRIRGALAILLAIMAIPAGVYSGLLALMANIGGILSTVFFFVIVFVLGLSHWYRTKAEEEFHFFMGSPFLTILIAYAPLIIVFTIAGIWLGGMKIGEYYLFQFAVGGIQVGSATMISLYVIAAIILFAVLGLFIGNWRRNWIKMIITLVIAGFVAILFMNLSGDVKAQSSSIGAFFGFAIGMGYASLEWGRRYGQKIKAIIKESGKELEQIRRRIADLYGEMAKLRSQAKGASPQEKARLMGEETHLEKEIEYLEAKAKQLERAAEGAIYEETS